MNTAEALSHFSAHKRYLDYPHFMHSFFSERIQKISIHAGFTCPNRDGSKGRGGCTFCNNESFSPAYCNDQKSITAQLEEGIDFFGKKHAAQHYIAYFQSYTNSYDTIETIRLKYEEALQFPSVIGIAIGTRPDCVSEEFLSYLQEIQKKHFVLVEYGIESTNNTTLLAVNRGHTYEESVDAICRTHEKGIMIAAHLILGLPGENRESILQHAKLLAKLPISIIKLHQLQIIKRTTLAKQYEQNNKLVQFYTMEEYIDLCIDFIEFIPPHICIERFVSQTPATMRIAPHWGAKNHEFVDKIDKRLIERDTYQGKYC
ncbi:MAG: TIGR01212 family radical SAM protein [Paludibacteraceae bacterium]|nr:TIGR01212 family radical SAM protein [Paludibacteraceae bacterium]MBP6285018.1 TIGR01212 family radical SAM protein [Paludibacteraceae bacterium]